MGDFNASTVDEKKSKLQALIPLATIIAMDTVTVRSLNSPSGNLYLISQISPDDPLIHNATCSIDHSVVTFPLDNTKISSTSFLILGIIYTDKFIQAFSVVTVIFVCKFNLTC